MTAVLKGEIVAGRGGMADVRTSQCTKRVGPVKHESSKIRKKSESRARR